MGLFKNKRIVALIVLIVSVITMTACQNNASPTTNPTDNSTENSTPPTTQTNIPTIPDDVFGIPGTMFEPLAGVDFDLTLKNLNNNKIWQISPNSNFAEFEEGFTDPLSSETKVQPGETDIRLKFAKEASGAISFGVVNEHAQESEFKESRVVYISCTNSSDIELCGLHAGMTETEIINQLGTPTQTAQLERNYSMEWYVFEDGHSYVINALLTAKDGTATKITLNIDNHSVYN